jgi:hypothetical protein
VASPTSGSTSTHAWDGFPRRNDMNSSLQRSTTTNKHIQTSVQIFKISEVRVSTGRRSSMSLLKLCNFFSMHDLYAKPIGSSQVPYLLSVIFLFLFLSFQYRPNCRCITYDQLLVNLNQYFHHVQPSLSINTFYITSSLSQYWSLLTSYQIFWTRRARCCTPDPAKSYVAST